MSDIKLTSKEYCESVFVDGPKFDKLSAFVSGPDAQVQGKLTAGTGINLNGSTISVNTATSVGISDLPITDRAVGDALNDYVNDIQADADCPIRVSRSGSSVTLSPNGGGNYVPLGEGFQHMRALPVGGNSTAGQEGSTAVGYYSIAGFYGTALGEDSKASGDFGTALGISSNAYGGSSVALGRNSECFATSSFAIGPCVTNRADAGGILGNFVRNRDKSTIVIGTFSGRCDDAQFTQLYLIAAGSDLSNQYCGGEAGLGYITTELGQAYDSNNPWPILACGTRKLSDLLTDHTTTHASPFSPDLWK